MLRELLAANINNALQEMRMSKKELGEKVGVHPNIVGRWVGGKSAPELDNVELIASALGKDPTWFFVRHGQVEAIAHTLPAPPPGTSPEMIAWITESLRAVRNPLTQLQELSADNLTMPVIAEVADLTSYVEELLTEEAPEESGEPEFLTSVAQSMPPEDLTRLQFLSPF